MQFITVHGNKIGYSGHSTDDCQLVEVINFRSYTVKLRKQQF